MFTRYLYNDDEVKLTLIESLLNQKNLQECYYWIYEFYQSKDVKETWDLLYKIYYDFYAFKNPKFLKKIQLKQKKFDNEKDIGCILWIIKNLFKFKKNYELFLLRVYYSSRNKSIINIDDYNENKFKTNDKNQKKLIISIEKKDKESISYYLKKTINKENTIELLNKILNTKIKIINDNNIYSHLLFTIINSFKIKSKQKIFYRTIDKNEVNKILLTDNINCIENKNYLNARIKNWINDSPENFQIIFPNPEKQIKFVLKQNKKEIEKALSNLWRDKDLITKNEKKCLLYFGSIMSEIIDEIDNPHKILKNKRKYNISDNISCFKLKRNSLKLNEIYWYKWEYYAYKSLIWKKRFEKYDIIVDDEKKLINFKNENEYHKFYEQYNYEPDEQSIEVQEKSIKKLKKINLTQWLNNIFVNKCKKNIRIKINY